jgi:flagellar protein FliO/FliZ
MIELALRVVFSLAVVVGLLLLIARFAGRRFQGRTGAAIQVLHRQQLSRGSSVAVVDIAGRVLVLGMTEHQVTMLSELDPIELEEAIELRTEALVGMITPPATAPATSAAAPPASPGGPGTPSDAPRNGPLAGSVLSPQTWRQAFSAVSGSSGKRPA